MNALFLTLPFLFASADQTGHDVSLILPEGHSWVLQSLDDAAPDTKATLVFLEGNRIAGKGPCNNYNSALQAELPAFAVGPVAATQMACPDLDKEQVYFDALGAMTALALTEEALTLSDDSGRQMVFVATPD